MTTVQPVIHAVPVHYAWDWPRAGWKIARANYGLAMAITAVLFVWGFCTAGYNRLGGPFLLGAFVQGMVSVYFQPGLFKIGKKWVRGEKAELSELFIGVTDPNLLKKFLPLALLATTLSTFLEIEPLKSETPDWLKVVVPMLGWTLIFTGGLMIFKDLPFSKAVSFSISAFFKNFIVFVVLAIVLTLVMLLSAVALVLPLIFVGIPLCLPMLYLLYASVFEGHSPETHLR